MQWPSANDVDLLSITLLVCIFTRCTTEGQVAWNVPGALSKLV